MLKSLNDWFSCEQSTVSIESLPRVAVFFFKYSNIILKSTQFDCKVLTDIHGKSNGNLYPKSNGKEIKIIKKRKSQRQTPEDTRSQLPLSSPFILRLIQYQGFISIPLGFNLCVFEFVLNFLSLLVFVCAFQFSLTCAIRSKTIFWQRKSRSRRVSSSIHSTVHRIEFNKE